MVSDKPQIFLLHFAGGNRYSFQFLKKYFETDYEFIPLELPGRGKRMGEQLLREREDAVQDYLIQIKKGRNQKPFIVYGHSMGASLALEVVAELEKAGELPLSLIVSGKSWPITGVNQGRYLMAPAEFKEGLRKLGGVPEKVLENAILFKFFSIALRSDFEIVEKKGIAHLEHLTLGIPIIALMGDQEEEVGEIKKWESLSRKKVITRILPGNHFFIYDLPNQFADMIKEGFSI